MFLNISVNLTRPDFIRFALNVVTSLSKTLEKKLYSSDAPEPLTLRHIS